MKKLMILLTLLFVLSGCASKSNKVESAPNPETNHSISVLSQSPVPIFYTPAYDGETLKALGVTLNSTKAVNKIGEIEVREIAQNSLSQLSVHPKSIHLEYGLITANVGIGAVSTEAKNANPELKDKKSISDIPVWIITFKGLLPDDYVPDLRGKQPLNNSSTVIDAITGKVLFGFGTGK